MMWKSQLIRSRVVKGASPPTNSSCKRHWHRLAGGQALVELAIFGSVMLGALAFLVRVGMTWNFQQEVRIASFRRALATSHNDDAKMRGIDGEAETEWSTGVHDAVATTFLAISDRQNRPLHSQFQIPIGVSPVCNSVGVQTLRGTNVPVLRQPI